MWSPSCLLDSRVKPENDGKIEDALIVRPPPPDFALQA